MNRPYHAVAKPPGNDGRHGFSILELLTVLTIIAIMTALLVPTVGTLMRSNQIDQSVNTLAGILEQARESAIAGNTYVWVAFSSPSTASPASGIWVATFQSQDGTESPINTTVAPAWQTSVTIPTTNLQLLNKLQNLPGVKIIDVSALPAAVATTINTTNSGAPPPTTSVGTLFEPGGMNWLIAPLQYVQGYSSSSPLTKAFEFAPNGEAHSGSATWYDYIQFAVVPTVGTKQTNSAILSISRLTGRTTVYRP